MSVAQDVTTTLPVGELPALPEGFYWAFLANRDKQLRCVHCGRETPVYTVNESPHQASECLHRPLVLYACYTTLQTGTLVHMPLNVEIDPTMLVEVITRDFERAPSLKALES